MGKKLILAVDDEPSILMAVEDTLSMNYDVITAKNGKEALRLIESKNPDLVIMDVMMPEMDGITAVKQLHKTRKMDDPPIVFLSAKAQMNDIEQGFGAGGFDYITKPFSPTRLEKVVAEVFARVETRKKIQQKKNL
ncbi:MAG TPA: response regulator [Candidatus Goldiibacteriota bacterium]|nr:response regulator [Candidatus Goldiibacteriota bacterium]